MNIQIAIQQFCEYSSFIRGYSNATISRYKSAMKLLTRVEGLEELSEATPERIRRLCCMVAQHVTGVQTVLLPTTKRMPSFSGGVSNKATGKP